VIRGILVAGLSVLAACVPATGPCDTHTSLSGNWRYAAIQEAPSHTTLSGTLAVTGQSCGDFTGNLDLTEVNALGISRRIAGPVSGKVIDATSVRFDAWLEAIPRQHIATLTGDSLAGTWVLVDGAGATASGSFGGHR
jgi:hypothetical protein